MRGFYQAIAAALPDLHIEVVSEYDLPGCSIREVVIIGTHLGLAKNPDYTHHPTETIVNRIETNRNLSVNAGYINYHGVG